MKRKRRKSGFELCEEFIGSLVEEAPEEPGGLAARQLIYSGCFILHGVAPLVFNDEAEFSDPEVVPRAMDHINAVLAATQKWVLTGDSEDLIALHGEPRSEFWAMLKTLSEAEESVGKMVDLLLEGARGLDPTWLAANEVGRERDAAEVSAFGILELLTEHVDGALVFTEDEIDWDNMYTVLKRETEKITAQST